MSLFGLAFSLSPLRRLPTTRNRTYLTLLKEYQITDVDFDFRKSFYMREVGPQLPDPVGNLDPLEELVSPLPPALGHISTKAMPNAQRKMALYLAEGGSSDRLLGLSRRHVLIGSKEANIDYVWTS